MTKEERKEYNRKYYQKNREKILEYSNKFYQVNKDDKREYSQKYYKDNIDKISEKNRKYKEETGYNEKYYNEHKEEILLKKSMEYESIKGRMNEYNKNYRRKRKKEDPLFNLISSLITLIYLSFKNNGYIKKQSTEEIIGYSFDELKSHLEEKFLEGMSWENKGEWHIDHIKPTSIAKTEEEIYQLNHYSNLQPLWGLDNIKKGNKY